MSKTANRVVKNTGYLYAGMAISLFMSLYTTRLILNALGASDYGIYGIVGGAIALLGFLNGSMTVATQRFMSYTQGEKNIQRQKEIFSNSIVLHGILSIIVVVVLELAAYPLFQWILTIPADRIDAAQLIYQFLIVSTVFTILSVPYDAAINAHENMRYYAYVGVFESLLKLIVAIFIYYTSYDKLIAYGFLMTLLSILILSIKFAYCKNKYSECTIIGNYYNRQTASQLMTFAGWTFVDTMGTMVGLNGGEVVMNHYFGPIVNAAGTVSLQLRGRLMAFTNSMLKSLNPVIIKKEGEGNREEMLAFTLSGAKMSYLLFAFLAIPFIIDAPFILKLWLGNVPDWAVCFSRIQMFIGLAYSLSVTLTTSLNASGIIKKNSIFRCIVHIIPLFLFALLYKYGAEPYWSYIIVLINYSVVLEGYLLYQCHLHCNLNAIDYLRKILFPCLICSLFSFVIGWIVSMLLEESVIRLFFIMLIIDFVLFLSSYIILLDNIERAYLRSSLVKVIGNMTKRRIL